MSFEIVTQFEKEIAEFFGSPYAVAVDSCTHGIELSIRHQMNKNIHIPKIYSPKRTYISIPFLANKLGMELQWSEEEWVDFYYVFPKVIDAAVFWEKDGYIDDDFMCISFQFQKHLSLGRGGVILCPTEEDYITLKKMSYDGRLPNVPWREQNIDTFGYHYYMTPETAQLGLDKLQNAIDTKPRKWVYTDWPDVSMMSVFKQK